MVNFEKHRPKGIATGTVIKILLALIVIVGLGTIVVAESEWLQDILESIGFPGFEPHLSLDDKIAIQSTKALAFAINEVALMESGETEGNVNKEFQEDGVPFKAIVTCYKDNEITFSPVETSSINPEGIPYPTPCCCGVSSTCPPSCVDPPNCECNNLHPCSCSCCPLGYKKHDSGTLFVRSSCCPLDSTYVDVDLFSLRLSPSCKRITPQCRVYNYKLPQKVETKSLAGFLETGWGECLINAGFNGAPIYAVYYDEFPQSETEAYSNIAALNAILTIGPTLIKGGKWAVQGGKTVLKVGGKSVAMKGVTLLPETQLAKEGGENVMKKLLFGAGKGFTSLTKTATKGGVKIGTAVYKTKAVQFLTIPVRWPLKVGYKYMKFFTGGKWGTKAVWDSMIKNTWIKHEGTKFKNVVSAIGKIARNEATDDALTLAEKEALKNRKIIVSVGDEIAEGFTKGGVKTPPLKKLMVKDLEKLSQSEADDIYKQIMKNIDNIQIDKQTILIVDDEAKIITKIVSIGGKPVPEKITFKTMEEGAEKVGELFVETLDTKEVRYLVVTRVEAAAFGFLAKPYHKGETVHLVKGSELFGKSISAIFEKQLATTENLKLSENLVKADIKSIVVGRPGLPIPLIGEIATPNFHSLSPCCGEVEVRISGTATEKYIEVIHIGRKDGTACEGEYGLGNNYCVATGAGKFFGLGSFPCGAACSTEGSNC